MRRATASLLTLVGLAALLVTLVAVNILTATVAPSTQIDLTAERLYTLSPGTRALLAKLDQPLTLRFYYSERLARDVPSFATYGQRVRDMLTRYRDLAHGKITLQVLDPQPFSDIEDRAVAAGLQGVPIDQGGELVYFGLVATNSVDDEESIGFFQPERERFLEYDLTRIVNKLANPTPKTVGLLSSLPIETDYALMQQGGTGAWAVLDQIKSFFTVTSLAPDVTEIPANVDVLMLVHPAKLSGKTQYAIDQFVMRGGKVLAFVDPRSEVAQSRTRMFAQQGMPPIPAVSNPDYLLKSWGVSLSEDVIGDRRFARRVNLGAGNRAQQADYLPWIEVQADTMNQDDAVTGQLKLLSFASAGILTPIEGATTKFEPLVTSSAQSEHIPPAKLAGPPDVVGLLRGFKSGGQQLTIAARLTGPAKTAFPDGPPKDPGADKPDAAQSKPGDTPAAEQLKESKGPINVILVADTDMLEDRQWVSSQQFFGQSVVTPVANNADFVVNALDNLTGSDALIGLRSRAISDRPFKLIRDLQQQADARFQSTEQALQDKLKEAEGKLKELRTKNPNGQDVTLTPEQLKAVEGFRAEMVATRSQLRDVQRALREDIDRVENRIRFLDIAAVPLVLTLAALILAWAAARRRRATRRPA